MALLETRLISGKGIVKLDTSAIEYKNSKIINVDCIVVRRPKQEYLNLNWNPPRSRYAQLVFLKNNFVIRSEAVEFPYQTFQFGDIANQNLKAIQCQYEGILESFENLGTSLGVFVVSVQNQIQDWRHVDFMPDVIKVVCYADTAIQVSVSTLKLDRCVGDTGDPKRPTPPPNPQEFVAPGVPVEVSPPYSPPNDDGDTVPNEIDQQQPPGFTFPYGEAGKRYKVRFLIDGIRANGVPFSNLEGSFPEPYGNPGIEGPLQSIEIVPAGPGTNWKVKLTTASSTPYLWEVCDRYGVPCGDQQYNNLRVIDITEVQG